MENLIIYKKYKVTDFWSKAMQKKKSKVTNESLQTTSQETTESVTINDKNQLTTLNRNTFFYTAAPTPAQDEVKQKINTENDILVGLYRKRGLGQLSQSDQKEITSRKATLQGRSKAERSYAQTTTKIPCNSKT